MALGASGSFGVVGMTAVTNWFLRKRTLALGILATGTGFSGALVPVLHWSILHYGWRATLIFSGLGVWAVGLPMSILVRDVPEKYGMLPDGEIFTAGAPESNNPKTGEGLPPKEENTGYTAWTILRVRAFWLIALSVGISMAGFHAIAAVGFPYLLQIGMSASIAGWTILLLILAALNLICIPMIMRARKPETLAGTRSS